MNIVAVDLLVDQNEEQCHTDQYESEKYLILRRGTDVQFQVNFKKSLCLVSLEGHYALPNLFSASFPALLN